jgi:hypothetical protein
MLKSLEFMVEERKPSTSSPTQSIREMKKGQRTPLPLFLPVVRKAPIFRSKELNLSLGSAISVRNPFASKPCFKEADNFISHQEIPPLQQKIMGDNAEGNPHLPVSEYFSKSEEEILTFRESNFLPERY